MAKLLTRTLAALLLIAAAILGYGAYRIFAPATAFEGDYKILYIGTNETSREAVLAKLRSDSIVRHPGDFDRWARRKSYWDNIRPGRYRIAAGTSVNELVNLLRSGRQTPARLVINKLRMPSDFARSVARSIEADSATVMAWFQNRDSLRVLGWDTVNWLSAIVPNTYEVFWTWSPGRVARMLDEEQSKWWSKNGRQAKADSLGLTPEKVHILASIVEEETNKAEDKPLVASVYLNRIRRGMPLQADPTVRFAMKDFVSNRVLYSHLRTPSPYNTYLNAGLPPGPICTPSPSSLDAVLNAPETDYIFFVAKPDFSGYSTFTTNLTDHNRAAKVYQDSLTAWLKRKAAREKAARDSAAAANATRP